ncbi:MAG TPA: TRASH domain-containing protein [Kiritimatiellia bacterium]|nr:TRASH domain-containing protein [Kiritimatiellia bacterium]
MRNSVHLLFGILLIASGALAAEPEATEKPKDKPYPFNFCIVQGDEFEPEKEPYVIRHEGQIYKVCCRDCYDEFKKDPAPHVSRFEALKKKHSRGLISPEHKETEAP